MAYEAAAQLRLHLQKCKLAYDNFNQFGFVFDNESDAKEFHAFMVKHHGARPLKKDEGLISEAIGRSTFYFVMPRIAPSKWQHKKEFEFEVNSWAVKNKSRYLIGPDDNYVMQTLRGRQAPTKPDATINAYTSATSSIVNSAVSLPCQ